MYLFDTNIFYTLGNFTPKTFPTIWNKIDALLKQKELYSVREVRRELQKNCPFEHIEKWVIANKDIFRIPNKDESKVVSEILSDERFQGLVKRAKILKGLPVADPFLIAAGKVHSGIVVTQESSTSKGIRIPSVCRELKVSCINLERFFTLEKIKY